jgi:small subunit ribosomal protein S16
MSVKIRLARQGAKKAPFYRIVVTEAKSKRDGSHIEQIGIYDPTRSPAEFRYEEARMTHWLSKGARASDTVRELVRRSRRDAEKLEKKTA